jgi:LAO/AO transport system ATPase
VLNELFDQFQTVHDRRALARLITLVARDEAVKEIETWLNSLRATSTSSSATDAVVAQAATSRSPRGLPNHSCVVAITGGGGVGKSSLIGKLIDLIRRNGQAVAVLACDPQSSLTGGALLGDRIRMTSRPDDDGVFIRSLAVPSGHEAIAPNIDLMIRLLAEYGFGTVILETAGAGQGDTAVRSVADVVVLMLQPETGDELQWEKAGLLEVADIVVVHKSDLPGADRIESQLREMLNLPGSRTVTVLKASASKGQGLEELWQAIQVKAAKPIDTDARHAH